MTRLCVVGGGPAGLAASIFAARAGVKVTILERNSQCGVKLLATGGGHANIGNLRPQADWPGLFGKNGRFILPALNLLPLDKLRRWLADLGQELVVTDGFHFFPVSNSAREVRNALVKEALDQGVEIRYGNRVLELSIADTGKWLVPTKDGGSGEEFDAVVLATGGKTYPATGSTWDGCAMAEVLGHRLNPAFPGLAGLHANNLDADLAGIVLPDAVTRFKMKGRGALHGEGELLLTHTGISGPAVLDISASVAEALAVRGEVEVSVRWRRDMEKGAWLERLDAWRRRDGAAQVAMQLREFLPLRLARWLCRKAGLDEAATVAQVRAGEREVLAGLLGAFPVMVTGTDGWTKAMITRGGVDIRDVNPMTLESRITPGLYFAGETLDIDGPCGGYNLHWAFASGALAGENAAARNY